MGSVVGSNIFNVLVILGLAALIIPLRVSRQLVRLDIPLMIAASALVYLLAINGQLGRLEGLLLLLGLLGYLAMLWHQSRHYARTYPAPRPFIAALHASGPAPRCKYCSAWAC